MLLKRTLHHTHCHKQISDLFVAKFNRKRRKDSLAKSCKKKEGKASRLKKGVYHSQQGFI